MTGGPRLRWHNSQSAWGGRGEVERYQHDVYLANENNPHRDQLGGPAVSLSSAPVVQQIYSAKTRGGQNRAGFHPRRDGRGRALDGKIVAGERTATLMTDSCQEVVDVRSGLNFE